MYIILQGTPEIKTDNKVQFGAFTDGEIEAYIQIKSTISFRDVTDEGVFLIAAQVAEIVKYGMSDSPSSRMLVEFHKKQPIIEEKS